jgi:hypothetical protein
MYSTCLFCHDRLGANEVIERFPVGRRLAFDPTKGRLWVVCPKCGRWNLTPLEERWEAIEDLERRVRATRLRVSTDNISLSRLPGGLDAIRIGPALRPEIASWRYGRVFRNRWRRGVPAMVALGGGFIGISVAFSPMVAVGALAAAVGVEVARAVRKPPLRVTTADGRVLTAGKHFNALLVAVVPTDGGWALRLPLPKGGAELLTGDRAKSVAATLLTQVNVLGANDTVVSDALDVVDRVGDPDRLFLRLARTMGPIGRFGWPTNSILQLPTSVRLAVEVAAHDATERQAMEGEMAALETAWRDAEAIAAIADNLLLPTAVTDAMDRITDEGRP